jgi:hypothetical protein
VLPLRAAAVLTVVALALAAPAPAFAADPGAPPLPKAVVAHIDTGINPYHEAFRDTGPLAYVHPSVYIPGYPADAPALRLTLDADTWQESFEADRAIWEDLRARRNEIAGQVFWIPGTKIIAATHLGAGGVYCPAGQDTLQPAPYVVHNCVDYPILDDHGHGTMTASRMGGIGASQCPECRVVSIEGLGDRSVKFAADLGFVDVQTNSWGYLVPHPVIWALDYAFELEIRKNLEEAAQRHLVYFGSGNGVGFFLGFATWPTQIAPTLVKGALWAGAHDNGKVTAWSGAPPHLVADGFKGLAAGNRSLSGVEATPFACCTSAASPYAASVGAKIVLEARRILRDGRVGVHDGVVAQGDPARAPASGPLADGQLTLDELRVLVKHSAQARPAEGEHDGEVHWFGRLGTPQVLPYGPGDNAFCNGCWTMPVNWTSIPADAPAYPLIGYGAANEFSLATARAVLRGGTTAPDRSDVDEFFEREGEVRDLIHHPEDALP